MHIVSKTKVLALIALLGLVGCASAPQTPVALNLGADKSFTYSADADGIKISERSIVEALERDIRRSSEYKPRYEKSTPSPGMYDVKGVEIVRKPGGIEVDYVNGNYFSDTRTTDLTRTRATFFYTLEENAGAVTVKVVAPKQLETTTELSPIFLPYATLDTEKALASDIEKIFKELNPSVLQSKLVKGEIDSKYSVDAITANFKRKCRGGFSVKDFGMDKGSGICALENVQVTATVQPYKDGSKVAYSFSMQYVLGGKGESSYSSEATKKMIASVESVVKD